MAEAQEVARLLRIGLVADDRSKRCDGAGVVAPAVLCEADVKANAGHLGLELFGFLKEREGVIPVFTAHGDDTEIGVSCAGLRIDGKDAPEGSFGGIKVAGVKGRLALCEDLLGIDSRTLA